MKAKTYYQVKMMEPNDKFETRFSVVKVERTAERKYIETIIESGLTWKGAKAKARQLNK